MVDPGPVEVVCCDQEFIISGVRSSKTRPFESSSYSKERFEMELPSC